MRSDRKAKPPQNAIAKPLYINSSNYIDIKCWSMCSIKFNKISSAFIYMNWEKLSVCLIWFDENRSMPLYSWIYFRSIGVNGIMNKISAEMTKFSKRRTIWRLKWNAHFARHAHLFQIRREGIKENYFLFRAICTESAYWTNCYNHIKRKIAAKYPYWSRI